MDTDNINFLKYYRDACALTDDAALVDAANDDLAGAGLTNMDDIILSAVCDSQPPGMPSFRAFLARGPWLETLNM